MAGVFVELAFVSTVSTIVGASAALMVDDFLRDDSVQNDYLERRMRAVVSEKIEFLDRRTSNIEKDVGKIIKNTQQSQFYKDYDFLRKYGSIVMLTYIPIKLSLHAWSHNLKCVTINNSSNDEKTTSRTFYTALDLFLVEDFKTARLINTATAFLVGSCVSVGIVRFLKIF